MSGGITHIRTIHALNVSEGHVSSPAQPEASPVAQRSALMSNSADTEIVEDSLGNPKGGLVQQSAGPGSTCEDEEDLYGLSPEGKSSQQKARQSLRHALEVHGGGHAGRQGEMRKSGIEMNAPNLMRTDSPGELQGTKKHHAVAAVAHEDLHQGGQPTITKGSLQPKGMVRAKKLVPSAKHAASSFDITASKTTTPIASAAAALLARRQQGNIHITKDHPKSSAIANADPITRDPLFKNTQADNDYPRAQTTDPQLSTQRPVSKGKLPAREDNTRSKASLRRNPSVRAAGIAPQQNSDYTEIDDIREGSESYEPSAPPSSARKRRGALPRPSPSSKRPITTKTAPQSAAATDLYRVPYSPPSTRPAKGTKKPRTKRAVTTHDPTSSETKPLRKKAGPKSKSTSSKAKRGKPRTTPKARSRMKAPDFDDFQLPQKQQESRSSDASIKRGVTTSRATRLGSFHESSGSGLASEPVDYHFEDKENEKPAILASQRNYISPTGDYAAVQHDSKSHHGAVDFGDDGASNNGATQNDNSDSRARRASMKDPNRVVAAPHDGGMVEVHEPGASQANAIELSDRQTSIASDPSEALHHETIPTQALSHRPSQLSPQTPPGIDSSPPMRNKNFSGGLSIIDDHMSRKSVIISFDKSGPKNQGTLSTADSASRTERTNRTSMTSRGLPTAAESVRGASRARRNERSSMAPSTRSTRSTRLAPVSNVAKDVTDALSGFLTEPANSPDLSKAGQMAMSSRPRQTYKSNKARSDELLEDDDAGFTLVDELEDTVRNEEPATASGVVPERTLSQLAMPPPEKSLQVSRQSLAASPTKAVWEVPTCQEHYDKDLSHGSYGKRARISNPPKILSESIRHQSQFQKDVPSSPHSIHIATVPQKSGAQSPTLPRMLTICRPYVENAAVRPGNNKRTLEPDGDVERGSKIVKIAMNRPGHIINPQLDSTKPYTATSTSDTNPLPTHLANAASRNGSKHISKRSQSVDIFGSPIPAHMTVPAKSTVLEIFSQQVSLRSSNSDSELSQPAPDQPTQNRDDESVHRLRHAGRPSDILRRPSNRKAVPTPPQQESTAITRHVLGSVAPRKIAIDRMLQDPSADPFSSQNTPRRNSSEFVMQLQSVKAVRPGRVRPQTEECQTSEGGDATLDEQEPTFLQQLNRTPGEALYPLEDPEKTLVESEFIEQPPLKIRQAKVTLSASLSCSSQSSEDSQSFESRRENLAIWREALPLHHRNVFDDLLSISHKLVRGFQDHETATRDAIEDYEKRAVQIVETMEQKRVREFETWQKSLKGRVKKAKRNLEEHTAQLNEWQSVMANAKVEHNRQAQQQPDVEVSLEGLLREYC